MKTMDEVETAIAANGTNENILTGRRYERAPFSGRAHFFSTGSAPGLREEINVGGVSITPRVVVNAQNRSPVVPDDLRVADVPILQGQLIQWTVSNTTAGALTHRGRVEFESE